MWVQCQVTITCHVNLTSYVMVVLSTTHFIVYDSEWITQPALKLFELSKEAKNIHLYIKIYIYIHLMRKTKTNNTISLELLLSLLPSLGLSGLVENCKHPVTYPLHPDLKECVDKHMNRWPVTISGLSGLNPSSCVQRGLLVFLQLQQCHYLALIFPHLSLACALLSFIFSHPSFLWSGLWQ